MKLLVSVRDADEAVAALAGGADLIDAKEPACGPLGPVTGSVMRGIQAAIGGARTTSAALGDLADAPHAVKAAREFAAIGPAFVKIGVARATDEPHAIRIVESAVRGAHADGRSTAVIAVAYADGDPTTAIMPDRLIEIAAAAGAAGVLLDTCNKAGPRLTELMAAAALTAWVSAARARGLLTALAGRLTLDDLPRILAAAPDIVGVRSAACEGGRMGPISPARVAAAAAVCHANRSGRADGHTDSAEKSWLTSA